MDDQTNTGQQPAAAAPPVNGRPTWDDSPDVEPGRAQLVREWLDKIQRAKEYWKPTFKRMEDCRQLAIHGAKKEWITADSYTVPLIPRQINVAVATLYAKDPRVLATRRKKLMYQIWDETPESLAAAAMALQSPDPAAQMQAQQLLQEVQAVSKYNQMIDKLGKTLGLCWDYYVGEQETNFKQQMKMLVRRVKVDGIGYVRLGFQRIMGRDSDVTAAIPDMAKKIESVEAGLALLAADKLDEGSAQLEALKLEMQDLQSKQEIILREGPVFGFPKSNKVIVDPNVTQIKTLIGAGWLAYEHDMTPKQVLEQYMVNVGNNYTRYSELDNRGRMKRYDEKGALCRVYEVENKKDQTSFFVCEGYPDFIQPPATPNVNIERFWSLFPIVFNEIEDTDDDKIPPSDVWMMRHPQFEYKPLAPGVARASTWPTGRNI